MRSDLLAGQSIVISLSLSLPVAVLVVQRTEQALGLNERNDISAMFSNFGTIEQISSMNYLYHATSDSVGA